MRRVEKELNTMIGSRLRELRVSHGLSRSEVAKPLGVTHQQLQKYETGSNRISLGRAYELSLFFGVSVEYFVCPTNDNNTKGPDYEVKSRRTLEFMKLFKQGTDEYRDALITLGKKLSHILN